MKSQGDFREILKKEGLKNTRHRNSILAAVEGSNQPITAEDIYLKLKDEEISISLSTVYRVLETLVAKGLVLKSNVSDEQKALFEINRMEHKHHLLCVRCRKMLSVDGCPLDDYEKLLEERLGFQITGHKLDIYGYCLNCKQDEKTAQVSSKE